MRDQYELRDEAIERMEGRLRREIRHRNRARPGLGWLPQTPWRAVAALAALVVASMAAGGAAVAAAYEAQEKEQRAQLAANYEQRVEIAAQRLELAKKALEAAQARVDVGLANAEEARQAIARVSDAEVSWARSREDLEEVRLSGRDPRDEISAPLVSGRDFVLKRLQLALDAVPVRLDLEKRLLENMRTRAEIGTANPVELEVARVKVQETEALLESLRRRIRVRQLFAKGLIDARRADLQALEIEAEMRQQTLLPKVDLAKRQIERLRRRVEVGGASAVELAEAMLRLRELEAELAKAELDLATIRNKGTGLPSTGFPQGGDGGPR